MKSKNKQFRKANKLSFNDAEEEEEEGDTGPAITIARPGSAAGDAKKNARKKVQEKNASLLSFGEEEEEPVVIKKSASKARLLRQSGAAAQSDAKTAAPSSTQMSAAGEYSKERLAELARATQKLPASKAPPRPPAAPGDGAFVLSGSFKRSGAPRDDRFQYDTAALLRSTAAPAEAVQALAPAAGSKDVGASGARAGTANGDSAAAAAAAKGQEEEEDDDLGIPDAETIRRAKEKRERLRSAHLAPDYVPLGGAAALTQQRLGDLCVSGGGGGGGGEAAAGSGSDEDGAGGRDDMGSDGEGDEEGRMRIGFLGLAAPGRGGKGKRSTGKGVLDAVAADRGHEVGPSGGDGEEEEDDSWAEEQIRKGLGGAARQPPAAGPAGDGGDAQDLDARLASRRAKAAGQQFGATDMAAIAAAGAAVLQALREGSTRLHATHAHTQSQLGQATRRVDDAVRSISQLEAELEEAGARYAFAQRFREYVADLVDMLQEKSPYVEVLEEELGALAAQRGQRAEVARSGDADELAAAQSAVGAALGVLGRGGGAAAAGAAAEAAYLEAEAALANSSLPVRLDEFGRDANLEERREAQKRAEARRNRTELPAGAPPDGVAEAELGMDTSDEEAEEVSHFNTRRAEVLELAGKIFDDADDAFAGIPAIKARLEECKRGHRRAYDSAYVSDSAPALFAPFVRVQLLGWDPLYDGGAGFEEQPWFGQLFEYGLVGGSGADGGGHEQHQEDEDSTLVPRLVAKLVLPLVLHRARHCWSPASVRCSRALAAALEALLVFELGREPAMQDLLQLVRERLKASVEEVALPAFPPAAAQAHPRTRAIQARRFGRAVRVLRSLAAMEGCVDSAWLRQQALVELVQRKLLPYVQAASGEPLVAFARLRKVVDALPGKWISQGPRADVAELTEVVGSIGRALQARSDLDSNTSKLVSVMLAAFAQ